MCTEPEFNILINRNIVPRLLYWNLLALIKNKASFCRLSLQKIFLSGTIQLSVSREINWKCSKSSAQERPGRAALTEQILVSCLARTFSIYFWYMNEYTAFTEI